MFHFYFKKLLQFKIQSFRNPHPKYYSKTTQPASLLEYLEISCGLSPERALTASKFLRNKVPKGGDSVLTFLKSQGFSNTHIKTMILNAPRLLYLKPETSLGPMIQFFKDKGLSEPDLVHFFVKNPTILTYSLEKSIKPSFDLLHSLSATDGFIIESRKRSTFWCNPGKSVAPNVSVLKKCGVPDHRILKFLNKYLRLFMLNPDRFNEIVNLVQEMGFQPSTLVFIEAVRVMGSLSRPVWDMKYAVYRSLGCSDEEIFLAFHRYPICISLSEEKIRQGMDFFVKELGWTPSYVLTCPGVLSLSMEKRILPRYHFLQVLVSKSLIKKNRKFKIACFRLGEKQFFKSYVMKYEAEVPDILNVYEGIIRSKLKRVAHQ